VATDVPAWQGFDTAAVWHPYTQHATADPPVPIVGGRGAYLVDGNGRDIFDAISSWWVTLHGHAHPSIARAIAEQALTLEQVIFAGFTHEPAARLAHELALRLPGDLSRVFYSDNGSTAVEVALKIALQYWRNLGQRRPLIAALEHAYHGDTFGAMSASGRGVFTGPFEHQLFEVARLPDPSEDDDTAEALARLIEIRGVDLAAVIVEPLLLGAGGMRVWDAEILRRIRRLTADSGILLIADEVLTGFGRTGPLFACGGAGITPDLICLSKGLTGGFLPLGATVARPEIFEAFLGEDRGRMLFHGHSYTANPLACAAALASLALLDPACAARLSDIEWAHREGLQGLAGFPAVRKPRVLGTVAAFDIEDGGEAGYLDPVGPELAAFALREGVLLRPLGNVVYLLPPYCATAAEVARVYDVLFRFLMSRRGARQKAVPAPARKTDRC
jgi:adenosylmethionine---8-amino-7-oxononanoate aminotransferase